MKIIALSEGSFTIDKSKEFIPFNKEQDQLQSRTPGSLLVEIQPFVIITNSDVILLDTGLGFPGQNNLQIHENLQSNGIRPDQVTKVCLSHLHKDHAGGVSFHNPAKPGRMLTFPEATYYVSRQEFDFAMQTGGPSYHTEDFSLLTQSGKLTLLNEERGFINSNIKYEVTGGHSPFHTVYWVMENGEVILFGGDVAPQLHQMKSRFIAKYDSDGKRSMQLRSAWWQTSQAEHWKMLFYHDIKTPLVAH